MKNQAAGWYKDPDRPGGHRHWDGEQWSASPEATTQSAPEDDPQDESLG